MTHVERYIDLFVNISADRIENMDPFIHPEIIFRDPFNTIQGFDNFKKLMYKTLHDAENPTFTVTHQAWDKGVLFLRWHFDVYVPVLKDWHVEGMSEVHFDEEGRIKMHIDHWDASEQFYLKIPGIGFLIRLIRQRLQIQAS